MPKTRFSIECPKAARVYLAGDFNGWRPDAQQLKRARKGEDLFVALVGLPAGRHEFRYVVDGEWLCCPESASVPNAHGTHNSVIEICA